MAVPEDCRPGDAGMQQDICKSKWLVTSSPGTERPFVKGSSLSLNPLLLHGPFNGIRMSHLFIQMPQHRIN